MNTAHPHAIDFGLLDLANQSIAQGCLTNSKHPRSFIQGVYPTHIDYGQSCFLHSVTGKEYIDYICGLGTCLFGYAEKDINLAIIKELSQGISYSLSSRVEVEVASKLKNIFGYERVKFLKTGSCSCSAAVKVARAYTGRIEMLQQGYSGWHDGFVCMTPPAKGVPLNHSNWKLHSIDSITDRTACVILEPIITDDSLLRIAWLKELKNKCTETGTVLIFDETITGLRYKDYAVTKAYGIRPDILILGKALANGMPLSTVMGPACIMDDPEYFVSSTFAGENASLAAASKVLDLLIIEQKYVLKDLYNSAQNLCHAFNDIFQDVTIEGYGTRGVFKGNEQKKWLIWQEACKAGILFGPSFFYNFCHPEYNDRTIELLKDINTKTNSGDVQLEGKPPQSPFAMKVRDE